MYVPIYRSGFKAMKEGKSVEDNPYCKRSEIEAYHEWLAGWNDAEMGYTLKGVKE